MTVPESPMTGSSFPSPDLRHPPSSSRGRVVSTPLPLFLSDPSPSSLLPQLEQTRSGAKGKGNEVRAALILRLSLQWAIERADVDLLGWLLSLDDPWRSILDEEAQLMEDEDGWSPIGMMIQASCGRQEAEQGVRLLVSRWDLNVGPRGGRDRSAFGNKMSLTLAGWTPLHLAAMISTPPLVSFLLTRGASPHELTHRGLTPYDLISDIADRQEIAVLLDHAISAAPHAAEMQHSLSSARKAMLGKRRAKAVARLRRKDEDEKRHQVDLAREKWIQEMAAVVEVSPQMLIENEGQDEGAGLSHDSIVFSLSHLDRIYDILITGYPTQCCPVARRALPANALYLHAKFAYYQCDETWLEELIEGAVERIEQGVYGNMENLAYLAFWAYNSSLLLHLLRSDEGLRRACQEMELLDMMEELIHAIHVFIIRVTERRIDAVLDTALLDHETLEDFDDVRFEGDWNFFKSIRGRKAPPKAVDVFGTPSTDFVPSSPSLFGSLQNVANGSPFKSYRSHSSISDLDSADSSATAVAPPSKPLHVTRVLSAVLMVLQLYDINPIVTVQAFSQIFFWIASELFNRILARKKYICRSKAVQIKMNITVLQDWVRANGLPSRIATLHLEPVTQLLQWLQCSSQIRQFDTLIGTLQSLKALNPLQMRRAVRDYRYEVNEGKMTEECAQYLVQLQKDWEKRRLQSGPREVAKGTSIDALFDGSTSLADFIPQSGPECLGELLDSKFMLPFQLPTGKSLVATPPPNAVTSPTETRSILAWTIPDDSHLRQMPDDFIRWYKERKAQARRQEESIRPRKSPSTKRMADATPSPALRSSQSLEALRKSAKMTFEPVMLSHQRSESFELEVRTPQSP
ncbi:DIL domain-domain-containing protein [Kockovaella imperatae]|uniref:DIL domain-domain-containing protein n=1 Tax=Kockovaella imperatae TaxID=4999 RepID=A0A1Y1US50_9TREE|nr:DIL domain-domain-containing protein [Kockovaella imperatae]ORX40447.1 DIL domain-domain-containing protein [Kockovaella imperatae]